MKKVPFKIRLLLAWKVLINKNYEIENYKGFDIIDFLPNRFECDIKGCKKDHEYCMSRTSIYLNFGIDQNEHFHVCEDHKNKLKGKKTWNYEPVKTNLST